jgi:hypothetical protein
MDNLTLLLLLFAGSGLLLIGLSLPLIQRRVRPNTWYGFRARRTLENPTIWYDVNAYAGRRLLISGIITTVAAVVLYFLPGLTIDGYALGVLFCGGVPLTIGLTQSFQYLKRLDK